MGIIALRSTWNAFSSPMAFHVEPPGAFHVEQSAAAEIDSRLSLHGFDPGKSGAQLLRLCEALALWSRQSNLTGQRGFAAIISGICADAIALAAALPDTSGIVDLGAGAGFPGIPLAILKPASHVILVESRERRHHFQRAALRELALPNAEPLLGRAETLDPRPQPLAIAQAIAEPAQALRWLLPWTLPGGMLCLPQAVSATPDRWRLPEGAHLEEIRRYRVLPEGRERLLWIGRRRD